MKNLKVQFKVKKIRTKEARDNGFVLLSGTFTKYPAGEQPPAAYHNVIGTYFGTIDLGDEYELEGCWQDDKKFGWQFVATSMELKSPQSERETVRFLMKKVKGVGKKTAQTLVDTFGTLSLQVIIETPEKLETVEGISKKHIKSIMLQVAEMRALRDNSVELSPPLSRAEVIKLIEKYGAFAADYFKANPYNSVELFGFEKCDYAAFRLKFSSDDPRRIEGGVLEVLKNELNNGHLYTQKTDLYEKVSAFLNNAQKFAKMNLSEESFENALKNKRNTLETAEEGERIYLKAFYEMENRIVEKIKVMTHCKEDRTQDDKIRTFLMNRKMKGETLEVEQEEAVYMVFQNQICILTGLPGTGKTHAANAIIQTITATEPHKTIALAAPTGKAAKRMKELTGMESRTLHSLMGIRKEKVDGKLNEIIADYVIIDESSMMDIPLFYALLCSAQSYTRILLIGDHNQLPSVGPGLILRDLIESGVVPVTRLTRIYRQSQESQIIQNAYNVLNGIEEINADPEKGDFYFLERKTPQEVAAMVLKCIKLMTETGARTIDDIQIITPQNGGTLGVDEMNKAIQNVFNPDGKIIPETSLRIGDKVIHTENNADLDVKNGETGKIIRAEQKRDGGREIVVDFGDKEVAYSERFFLQLKLAYALTVHKMQGSEASDVIMIIDKSHERMLSRAILYTALTRAKKRMVLIGDREMYFKGIRNVENVVRRSGIKEKLQKWIKESA